MSAATKNNCDGPQVEVPLSDFCDEPPPVVQPPPGTVIPCKAKYEPSCVKELQAKAFAVFEQSFQFYKPNEFMIAFNGGKDCTVLLHLLVKFYSSSPALRDLKLPVLYIETDDGFDEVNQFVDYCTCAFDIEMWRSKGKIKDALFDFCGKNPHIKAIFLGSRRTDPNCGDLKLMAPTDADYPPLMRISPLLEWSYSDIWKYIFVNAVPYCSLYNEGYTSLGTKSNTRKNPSLRVVDDLTREVCYRPAYELDDERGTCERVGRS